jgi:hypothetical protein
MFIATVVLPVDPYGLVMAITVGDEACLGETREVIDFAKLPSI